MTDMLTDCETNSCVGIPKQREIFPV